MKIRNLLLTAFLLAVGRGWASDLQILLDSSTLTAFQGQQVTFSGMIVNNDLSTVDLNDINITLDGMFSVDVTDFFAGPPTVDASTALVTSETVDFDLFTVLVNLPYTDPLGVKTGTLTILGGVEGAGGYDPTVENLLGSVVFQVNVATPETSTATMMFAAAVLLCVYRRRTGWRIGTICG